MYIIKKFKIRKGRFKLKGSSFRLPSTGVIAIKGCVGSGKSTFLKSLYNNKIRVKNSKCKFSKLCTYVPTTRELIKGYTGNDYLNHFKTYKTFDENIFNSLLKRLNMLNLLNSLLTDYSDGEKSRFFFACALAMKKSIVLLDEPTSRVDDSTARIIIEIIEEFSDSKLFIIATHDGKLFNKYPSIEINNSEMNCMFNIKEEKDKNIETIKNNKLQLINSPHKKLFLILCTIFTALMSITSSILFHSSSEIYFPSKNNYLRTTITNSELRITNNVIFDHYREFYLRNINNDKVSFSPTSFKVSLGNSVSINLDDLKKKEPTLNYIAFISTAEDYKGIKISSGLKNFLSKFLGDFEDKSLSINGLRCMGSIKNEGYIVYIPKSYAINAFDISVGVQDYRKVYGEDGESIILDNKSVSVDYSLYSKLRGKTLNTLSGELTINSYHFDYNKRFIFNSSVDFSSISFEGKSRNYFKSLSTNIFSTDENLLFDSPLIEDFELDNYINYLKNKNYDLIFWLYIFLEFLFASIILSLSYLYVHKSKNYFAQTIIENPNIYLIASKSINILSLFVLLVLPLFILPIYTVFLNSFISINILKKLLETFVLLLISLVINFVGSIIKLKNIKNKIL